tara:strand:- start:612 stop:773 length:162 start_codon:yes stop_codon:yes gene_type:complete
MNRLTQELRIVFITSDKKVFFDRPEARAHQKELDDTAETEEEFRNWKKNSLYR